MKQSALFALIFLLLVSPISTAYNVEYSTAPQSQTCEITVWVGEKVVPDLIASDPDEAEGYGPAGTLIWTYYAPLNAQGEWQTSESDLGIHQTQVTVDDGEFTDTIEFCIEVVQSNYPPQTQDIEVEMFVGETIKLLPQVFDPDSTKAYVSFASPISSDGLFTATAEGLIQSTFTVSDGDAQVVGNIRILVMRKPNNPPTVDVIPQELTPLPSPPQPQFSGHVVEVIHSPQQKVQPPAPIPTPKVEHQVEVQSQGGKLCLFSKEECDEDIYIAVEVETLEKQEAEKEEPSTGNIFVVEH